HTLSLHDALPIWAKLLSGPRLELVPSAKVNTSLVRTLHLLPPVQSEVKWFAEMQRRCSIVVEIELLNIGFDKGINDSIQRTIRRIRQKLKVRWLENSMNVSSGPQAVGQLDEAST